jgi:hypothetical protein
MGNTLDKLAIPVPECEALRQAYMNCSNQKLQQSTDGTLSNYDKLSNWEQKCFQEFDVRCVVVLVS